MLYGPFRDQPELAPIFDGVDGENCSAFDANKSFPYLHEFFFGNDSYLHQFKRMVKPKFLFLTFSTDFFVFILWLNKFVYTTNACFRAYYTSVQSCDRD